MITYVFTIQFLNENDNIEYSVIKGVYDCKETAKEQAIKALKSQQAMWPDSYATNLGKGKVALKCPEGCSKIYHIQEFELNK